MPTLFVLNGWKIQMFAKDYNPPHIHVVVPGGVYRFYLSDFQQLPSDVKKAPDGMARTIMEWGHRNRAALDAAYQTLQARGVPDKSRFVV